MVFSEVLIQLALLRLADTKTVIGIYNQVYPRVVLFSRTPIRVQQLILNALLNVHRDRREFHNTLLHFFQLRRRRTLKKLNVKKG